MSSATASGAHQIAKSTNQQNNKQNSSNNNNNKASTSSMSSSTGKSSVGAGKQSAASSSASSTIDEPVSISPTNTTAPTTTGGLSGSNRAIRFYDDYIDFRGDVLHRPPNSKACRILWEYLYLLLQDTNYASVIKWEDESQMVFRIVQAEKLAALWGLQKNRLGMTYEKLSRGMRYYYPNNIIAREPGRRLLYRFVFPSTYLLLLLSKHTLKSCSISLHLFSDSCDIRTR